MSTALKGNDDEKLLELCSRTYKEQIIWFLNSFWDTLQGEAEQLWKYNLKCAELDLQKRGEGNALDELNAHVFLEHFKETLTVREMRTKLRETGAIGEKDRPKTVPITHYLLFKYNVSWHELVNASQGSNEKEIREAQRLLEEVQAAFAAADARAQEAKAAHAEAKAAEAEAKAREAQALADEEAAKAREAQAHADADASRAREEEAAAAQAELEAALAEVKAQEDAYNAKTADLTRKSEEGGVVSRNKAKNELAQHLSEDPLPLRRAKITAEAAVKKADRTRQAAAEARQAAEASAAKASEARHAAEESAREATAARHHAEESARHAEAAKAAAEAAVEEARRRLAEAEAYLQEVKSRPGSAHGALWWIERELTEAKAYLPESKGGYRKAK